MKAEPLTGATFIFRPIDYKLFKNKVLNNLSNVLYYKKIHEIINRRLLHSLLILAQLKDLGAALGWEACS